MLRSLLAATAALALLPFSAQAGDGPSVAVIGVHGAGQREADLVALAQELERAAETTALSPLYGSVLGELLAPSRARIVEAVFLEPAIRAYEEGRILYGNAQPDLAVAAFQRARDELEGVEEFVTDPRLMVEAPLLRGLAHLAMGEEGLARRAFQVVVRRDPNRVLDPLQYPPRFVDTFESVRAQVLEEDPSVLAVEPAGRVFVDGRAVGVGPVDVPGLPPGRHTVLVDAGSRGRAFAPVRLEPGGRTVFARELQRRGLGPAREVMLTGRDPRVARYARAIGEVAGTDLVLLASFEETGALALALYSTRSGTWTPPVTASLEGAPGQRVDYLGKLLGKLASYVEPGGTIRGEVASFAGVPLMLGANPVLRDLLFGTVAPAAPVDEPRRPTAGRKKPAPGAVVAAVVGGVLGAAGAGVGIYFATRPEPSSGGVLVVRFP